MFEKALESTERSADLSSINVGLPQSRAVKHISGITGQSVEAEVIPVAGLVMAKRYHLVGEYLTDEELREIILMTAEDTICASDPPGFDTQYGRGRVNA